MKPSSAMSLASNSLGQSALFCAIAGVAASAASAAVERSKSLFVNICRTPILFDWLSNLSALECHGIHCSLLVAAYGLLCRPTTLTAAPRPALRDRRNSDEP